MTIEYHDNADGSRRVTDDGRDIGTIQRPRTDSELQGLQPWSTHQSPVIIFSVYRDSESCFTCKCDHAAVAAKLEQFGVPFDSAHGAYNGKREQCFIIKCDIGKGYETIARTIAEKYQQESVLYITGERVAFLETCAGDTIAELGKLRTVSETTAKRARAYTFANGCYYVAG